LGAFEFEFVAAGSGLSNRAAVDLVSIAAHFDAPSLARPSSMAVTLRWIAATKTLAVFALSL
jgi:hypothetical protein